MQTLQSRADLRRYGPRAFDLGMGRVAFGLLNTKSATGMAGFSDQPTRALQGRAEDSAFEQRGQALCPNY